MEKCQPLTHGSSRPRRPKGIRQAAAGPLLALRTLGRQATPLGGPRHQLGDLPGRERYGLGLRVAVDAAGNTLVAGLTNSTDLAGANNSYHGGEYDAFVAKVKPDGTLAWATYLGGSGISNGWGDRGTRSRWTAPETSW